MTETLRSIVHPWECDAVDHFTTAYYFRAFALANRHLMILSGLDEGEIAALDPVSCRTTFSRELQAGDPYHIVSGVAALTRDEVTLAHILHNSETGETCATHAQIFRGPVPAALNAAPEAGAADAPSQTVDFDSLSVWSTTSQAIVRPGDLDESGRFGLTALIHLTSDGNVQFQNMIAMTSSYMRAERIGFATVEYRIAFHALPAHAGTLLENRTALAHLGRTSLRFAHRVHDKLSGKVLVEVAQFGVHFDRTARRPAEIPPAIREAAEAREKGGT